MQFPNALCRVTAPDAEPAVRLSDDLSCDVTIVGAGFTCLRLAIELAQAGTRVAVFDAGDVGYSA